MANSAANLISFFSSSNSPLIYFHSRFLWNNLCSHVYRHLNMMEESNSNAATYSGTRQGKKEEDYVYAGQCLLSVTTTIWIPTHPPPPHCPPGLI